MGNSRHRKKNIVMKPKAQPRIGQENRQRPTLRNGLMDNDLKLATWNVRTLLQPGRLKTLTDVLKTIKINITAIQESRWPGADLLTSREYSFYYSGKEDGPREFGTGFVVLGKARDAVIGFNPVDERLCSLRIRGKFFNYTLINAHAPTEELEEDMKEEFYEKLQAIYDQAPDRDIKICLGDFNAKVGREVTYRPAIGTHSLHENSNDNGCRLIDFAVSNNMVVSSTYFPHKNIHKATDGDPDGITKNQIDHVLIDGRHCSNILDVRSFRGPNIDSDHFLVRVVLRARIQSRNEKTAVVRRYDIDRLKNMEIRKQYVDKLEERIIADIDLEHTSINDTWNQIKQEVESVATETIGWKTGDSRNEWYDDECKLATQAKNEARMKTLQRRATRAMKEDYRSKRKIERKLFRKKKADKEKELFVQINSLAECKDTRKLYQRIKNVRNGYSQQPLLCKDESGSVLADEEKCLKRWTEYFRSLLNQSRPETLEEENAPEIQLNTQFVETPTLEEVRNNVQKLKNNKSPGSDNLPGELFKYGGEALCQRLHELIVKIWEKEELPEEWELGIICPIYKKGDKLECDNYRGINLLNIAYKLFANILYNRLRPHADETIGEYQGGFRNNRSTTDQLFCIRQVLEKCKEFNVETHHLFVDFKAAYDRIIRKLLWGIMAEFGFPAKLIALTKLTLLNVKARVRIRNNLSEIFETMDGLRQGDPLATLLFNIVLEKIVRNSTVETSGTIYRKTSQLLGYADDLDMVGRNVDIVKENYTKLDSSASIYGLEVNERKTKYMVTSSSRYRSPNQMLVVGGKHFEEVNSFVYLGSLVNSENNIGEEIRRRVTLGNRSFYSLQKLFRSKTLHRNLKCQLYRSLVRPILAYGSEAWCMTQTDEQTLLVFERRILRTIFGGIQIENNWRRRFNHELYELYAEPDIVKYIKINRLRWFGHVLRMDEERVPLKMLNGHPDGTRRAGRPKGRWKDAVESNLKSLKVKDWRTLSRNRSNWRSMLEEAKTKKWL